MKQHTTNWADIVLPAALCITYLFIFQTLILP